MSACSTTSIHLFLNVKHATISNRHTHFLSGKDECCTAPMTLNSWRNWFSCSIPKSHYKEGESKLVGMHKNWLSKRSFWENTFFVIKTFSWTHFLARTWDAELGSSTKQTRRSCKALFARGRLKGPVRPHRTHRAFPKGSQLSWRSVADQEDAHLAKSSPRVQTDQVSWEKLSLLNQKEPRGTFYGEHDWEATSSTLLSSVAQTLITVAFQTHRKWQADNRKSSHGSSKVKWNQVYLASLRTTASCLAAAWGSKSAPISVFAILIGYAKNTV